MFGITAGAAEPAATPPPSTPAPAATNGVGPRIQFETMVHDFGKAKSGEIVKYTYAFTNGGDQVLQINGVQACGCITADYTKKVEPGMTGSIPISFNSGGYGGQIIKSIIVTCNDRSNSRPVLQFKGTLWRPIDFTPQFVVLNLTADAPLASATVVITNNLPDPVDLFPPQCSNPAFTVELRTNQPGRDFRLVIAPAKPLAAGNAQTQVSIKTSSTNMPVISITAFATVQSAVTINPPQIALPAGPLAHAQTNVLNIANNSTNRLFLSEAAVNAAGVEVQLNEGTPGRYFTAMLSFPQGFEVAPGQPTEFSVKSSFSAMPLLKVPIVQPPRPASPTVPPLAHAAGTNRHRARPTITMPPLPPGVEPGPKVRL
jgi:Protein of unknown function (DUF1573)